jgi:hypothetical protein
MCMNLREDPPDSVIDEIAAILAIGYLRLCKARHLAESAVPPADVIGERVDSTHGANTS